MRYILNSAVLTAPGTYQYRLIGAEEAREWALAGPFVSRVGYAETAQFIRDLTGVEPELSREESKMEPGDEALVVRLKYRLRDPKVKGAFQPGPDDWELGRSS